MMITDNVDLDKKGIFKYNQLKGIISPTVSCFANSLCEGYEIYKQSENCWDNIKNYHTEYSRIADKFMYFCRFETSIREIYKLYYPIEYNNWINDKNKDEFMYSDNSYPPNEIFKVITVAFNLFINMNKIDEYKNIVYIDNLITNDIISMLDKGKPVVSSFKLDSLGHIMCIKGYNPMGFLIYDTYGCKYMDKFQIINNSKLVPYSEFNQICKPIDNRLKKCICFE